MQVLGNGVYDLAEAAKLTDLRSDRVRDWFRAPKKEGAWGRAVFRSDYPQVGKDRAISFLDLIEVSIVGRLRDADPSVPLARVRKAHQMLSEKTGNPHPFCHKQVFVEKGAIFAKPLDEGGPLTSPARFNDVVMPFLAKIEYDEETGMARRWNIAEGVVLDPARNYGKPIVAEVGIATWVLAGAYEGNGRDYARVADWYEVEPKHVKAAVEFEDKFAA